MTFLSVQFNSNLFKQVVFFKILCIFREGGRVGERGGVKHQCMVASSTPCTATQACALTGSQTMDALVCRPTLNPLNYASQGYINNFNKINHSQFHCFDKLSFGFHVPLSFLLLCLFYFYNFIVGIFRFC